MRSRRSKIMITLALLTLTLPLGCATRHLAITTYGSEYRWPINNPKVELEQSIRLSQDDRRSSPPGGSRDNVTTNFVRPYGVALRGSDILITDQGSARVARISKDGSIRFSAPGLFHRPVGIASCLNGIVVSDSEAGTVLLLDEELRMVQVLKKDLDRPTGVACDESGLYIVETKKHRIHVLKADGSVSTLGVRGEGPGQFNYPTVVGLDKTHGTLLVGDAMNFRIQVLDRDSGAFKAMFGTLGSSSGEMPRIKGIGVDSAGQIWVSDAHLDQVSLYGEDGTLLISLGGTGSGATDFSFPAGIATNAGDKIVIVDSYNKRLQIYRNLGLEHAAF